MLGRAKRVPKGTCALCKSSFAKSAMTKHLKLCIGKAENDAEPTRGSAPPLKFFHLLVEGRTLPQHWMHLKASSHARLQDLDYFLRKNWLECCGHMSAFWIGREEVRKSKRLEYVFRPGMQLHYEYDFGSTTELTLKVISEFKSNIKRDEVEILARNDPPQILCSYCNNLAKRVCVQCIDEDGGWLCDDCAGNHKCGEDMVLPVVNSPRTGVCGYMG